jgi:hypothetical protein
MQPDPANGHPPVPTELLMSQIAKADGLLATLRSHPDANSPKLGACVHNLEEARLRISIVLATRQPHARGPN